MSDIRDLIPPLHKATTEKKLFWKLDSDNIVSANLGVGLIEIVKSSTNAYDLRLRNMDGISIDVIHVNSGGKSYQDVEDIFIGARRSALKVDETVAEIAKKLLSL